MRNGSCCLFASYFDCVGEQTDAAGKSLMRKLTIELTAKLTAMTALTVFGLAFVSFSAPLTTNQVLTAYQETGQYAPLTVLYPDNDTVFPPEIVPCTFSWRDNGGKSDNWLLLVRFGDDSGRMSFLSSQTNWTPTAGEWESIKQRCRGKQAELTVLGFRRAAPDQVLSRGRVKITTSDDPVGAPLFYREVNLPFAEAVTDPSRIRWRFGAISSPEPPRVVLENLPVCGNCHSFSRDGQVLGMDVDYANNKGSYAIAHVAKEMALTPSEILTWDDYRKEDGQKTLGLLSQISPDGQAVVSTVKDKSVFVAKPDLAFSQLFFPVKGILAVYHRDRRTFQALLGADDPQYVQSNPTWSPDGKYIVFARSKAYELKNQTGEGAVLMREEDCPEFLRDGKPFTFDLYRVPYNNGQGGKAEPLAGASRNGRSNYFPKYSPDGKWIVFCQARNYMLLQPDSELYIIPAEGGEARRLKCNTARMNSWHSWSPNSRWLVFSSKVNSPYTQLFLTHIDERGESSPPVRLANFTSPGRAANIPEFVNTSPDAIARINPGFLNDYSHVRAAFFAELSGDTDHAIVEYQRALELNPGNVHAHQRLGFLLYNVKHQQEPGLAHTREALRLAPYDGYAHYDLGMAMRNEGKLDEATQHFAAAERFTPAGVQVLYDLADMHCSLGEVLLARAQVQEATGVLSKAVALDAKNARAHYFLALAQAAQGMLEEPLQHYSVACSLQPTVDKAPELHFLLSRNLAGAGRLPEALRSAQKALELAQARGDTNLVATIQAQIEDYRRKPVASGPASISQPKVPSSQ
jgi:tetratricopeptide (TPR) repeat protein